MLRTLRPTLIIGNWKMHKTITETKTFVSGLGFFIAHTSVQVGLAVPYTTIAAAAEAARGTAIAIGAQNVSGEPEGAFTGEISCSMLKDAGASFVIVGHSERRRLFHEDEGMINRKLHRAIQEGLRVVLCIGETLTQRQTGKLEGVLQAQLRDDLKGLSREQLAHLVIAYEPVWAIGNGHAATPEEAEKAHALCREVIKESWGQEVAERMVILYGGSVKPEQAAALLAQEDIDGLLVGGASLSLDSFSKIILSKDVQTS